MVIAGTNALQGTHHKGHEEDSSTGDHAGAARPGAASRVLWSLVAAAAAILAALWLRSPSVAYVVACAVATALAFALAVVARRRRRGRRGAGWRFGFVAASALFCLTAARAERVLWRVEHDWPRFSARIADGGARALRAELDATAEALRVAAERAVRSAGDPATAFRLLDPLAGGRAERGVVLWEGDAPLAWSGTFRVAPDSTGAPFSITIAAFYVALHATARDGGHVATATALLHAEPPADRLSRPLDARVAERTRLAAFAFDTGPVSGPGAFAFAPPATSPAPGDAAGPGERPLFVVRPIVPARDEVRLRELERARGRGALLLLAAVTCFLAVAWPRPASSPARLASLAVPLAAIVLVPLNTFSNRARLLDPSFYFAPLGGPFTSSVGALALTSGVVLLGLLALLRSRVRLPSRWLALAIVLAIAGSGPFLLRKLAAGISPPAWGVPTTLWLAWQVAIFLAATSVLVAGASAGRVALGGRRGLPPLVAPALAAVTALLGPLAWRAPGEWPEWYPMLWVVAIGALAFTRASRSLLLAAALVAGFGAETLVWGATSRKRVELAERDVIGLSTVEPEAAILADRFAAGLQGGDRPRSRAELLRRFVGSELAAAGYPVGLASWAPDGMPEAELAVWPVDARRDVLQALVGEAAARARPLLDTALASPGVQLLLAVPHGDGGVTTAVIAPRTRLLPDDPFAALLGVAPATAAEPPYALTPVEVDPSAATSATPWSREGNEMHGNWTVPSADGPRRVHVEVELRELDALVQRGVLVVLLDVAIAGALWVLVVLADGGIARWARARQRGWSRSFRARLSLALFGFFVIPAVAFAAWSYRRLQGDDVQSRELLVRETLRAVATGQDVDRLIGAGTRLETPLLLYDRGMLAASSDTLYQVLAPIGRFLRPEVHRRVVLGDEIATRSTERVGDTRALFGYRMTTDSEGDRVVLAAPARTNELALDRRRRDLGVLVAFATVLGALGTLWLSGVAARQLAQPIATLRRAALAIAAGEREPALPGEPPPAEFVPVFNAFRRMASDLDASRTALEEAQRRTAAVLRNVASGVVAVNPEGSVLLANPQADLLLGRRLPPGTVLADGDVTTLAERVQAFVRSDAEDEEFDLELHDRQLHARLTRLSRGAGGTVLTLDDVTELARAQRVLAWGEMARQVAHEIKNPLTPIRLGVQHLKRAHADRRPDFDRILGQNVERILGEIDRLDEIARAFSRYGTAPAERPPAQRVDAAAVVRDVVELERMGAGGVDWRVRMPDEPAWALAGAEELREVVLNLLENARLAGARTVQASVARDDGIVAIAVSDDGEGIPEEALPRIFEPHFSTRTSGSGLGLAISRRLVDGWGGSIGAESERGKGTTVTVRLRAG